MEKSKQSLQNKKEVVFTELTELCDYFKSVKSQSFPAIAAKYHRLSRLEDKWDGIFNQILEYNEQQTDAEEQITMKDRKSFNDLIDTIRCAYLKAEQDATRSGNDVDHGAPQQTGYKFVTGLPKLHLVTFEGATDQWNGFITLFDSLVHDNPSISSKEKFHYLKAHLKGEALATISLFEINDDNYHLAYEAVNERYQNSRRLANFYLERMLRYKPGEKSISPQQFLDVHKTCINALKKLPLHDLADFLLFQISYNDLDSSSQSGFDLKSGSTAVPTSTELLDYVQLLAKTGELKRDVVIQIKSSYGPLKSSSKSSSLSTNKRVTSLTTSSQKQDKNASQVCSFCHQEHFVAFCPTFKTNSVDSKWDFVQTKKLCFNCLGPHFFRDCRSVKTCHECRGKHHTLLHRNQEIPKDNISSSTIKVNTVPVSTSAISSSVSSHLARQSPSVLLAAATILVQSSAGDFQFARALIDQGSQRSFISEALMQRLHLGRSRASFPIQGIGAIANATTRGAATLTVSSRINPSIRYQFEALVLPKLTSYMPLNYTSTKEWPHLSNLILADISSAKSIDLLLGADIFALVIEEGLKKGPVGSPMAQKTVFGWILSGLNDGQSSVLQSLASFHCSVDDELLTSVQHFWEQEEIQSSRHHLTNEEIECENHYEQTHSRTPNGRYVVRLLFKANVEGLGESLNPADRAWESMERRFKRDPTLESSYHQFLEEYEDLGHMTLIQKGHIDLYHFYLPHLAVVKTSSSTTKLRVVFNGSQKSRSGVLLNDILHVGPQLLPSLMQLVMKWRQHKYVFSANIEKMYRQILIHKDDRRFQLILWRPRNAVGRQTYQLNTVTYGLACAPYLAIRTLHQLSSDEEQLFPVGSLTLREDVYVDDVISGADTLDEALLKQKELIEITDKGEFILRKWTANTSALLDHLPSALKLPSSENSSQSPGVVSLLGLSWQAETDCFILSLQLSHSPEVITKRSVLSQIAQLFDPIGWLSPVIIRAKIFMQSLWLLHLSWDEELPLLERHQWLDIFADFNSVTHVQIQRWNGYSQGFHRCEVHGFADASQRAYGAAVYLKTTAHQESQPTISLLVSKTRVAPIKQISIPRLELNAALLLAQLVKEITMVRGFPCTPIHLWTDSSITLTWIQAHASQWKTFVANRVSMIQTTIPNATWHHVPTKDNPADLASRGIKVSDLVSNQLWWCGPSWLKSDSTEWPSQFTKDRGNDHLMEDRLTPMSHVTTITDKPMSQLISKFSEFRKLLRILTWCYRYLLKLKRDTHLKSSLLNPYLHTQGLLRVGGRLNCSHVPFDQKHPVILPQKHILQHLS